MCEVAHHSLKLTYTENTDGTLVPHNFTHGYGLSKRLQRQFRDRRRALRPPESPRREDICHCVAASSGGKKTRSFLVRRRDLSQVIHQSGGPLCQHRSDPTMSLPGCLPPAKLLFPVGAHYRRPGYPHYDMPLAALIPRIIPPSGADGNLNRALSII